MTVVIGMVTEGPNDQRVISAVVTRVFADIAPARDVRFRRFQPASDRSGPQAGGWTEVRKWCARNGPGDREVLIFRTSLTGEPACSALIVQLDGDAIDQYADPGSSPMPMPWPGRYRASYAESVLHKWVWPDRPYPHDDGRHILVVPVWATETWLAAALDDAWHDPEEHDPAPRLQALRPRLANKGKRSGLRKRGLSSEYDGLAATLAQELINVRRKCRQLDKFCVSLENLMARLA